MSALILMGFAFLPFASKATHISGADLTYRWISGNTYELTLELYRDCSGVAAPNNVTINYSSISCGVNSTVTISRVPGTGNEISMTCSTAVTTCQGGSYPGFQKYEYRGNVTLPNRCADWIFGYSICCRNCAITTLQYTPANCTGVPATYIEATLNNLVVTNNSAPIFTNIPVLFFCIGQTFHFNHGAYDSDGDSLVYTWVTPRSAAGTNVVFKPGYSVSSPISSSPAITLDNSGDITITPTALEVGVMAILVKEYRNGVLVGSVIRDMEVWTQNCSNIIPTSSGVNGSSTFDIVACPGKPITFNINSNDPNSGQAVTMTYIGNISGASFTSAGSPFPTGTFTWTPTLGQARSQPYTFLITVQDNNCPMNGYQTYSFTILVPPLSSVTAGVNATCAIPPNGSASVTATGSAPFTYSWSPGGSTASTASGLAGGSYTVVVTDRYGCTSTATSTITQPSPISVTVTTSPTTCGNSNGSASVSVSGGNPPYSFNWMPDTTHIAQRTGLSSGTYNVIIIDANGCSMPATATVVASPPPSISAAPISSVTCYGGSNGSASAAVTGGLAPFTYHWTPTGGNSSTASSLTAGSYSVQLTDANGCTSVATTNISQPSPLVLTPTVQDGTCGFNNGTAQVVCLGGTPGYTYLWTPGSSTASSISSLASGNYTVRATDANGCTSTSSMTVSNSGTMTSVAATTSSVSCYGGANATASVSFTGGTPPFSYQWTPGGFTTGNVSGLSAGTYSCTITDAHNCTVATSAVVSQPARMLASTASSLNANCYGQANGTATVTVSGGTTPYTYQWQGLPATSSSVSGLASGSYNVVVTDVNGCQTSSQANISQPTPITANSTIVPATCGLSNGSAQIIAGGGVAPYTYLWSTGSTSSSVSGLAAGSYSVVVTDAHSCSSTFSIGVSNMNGPQAALDFVHPANCFGDANGSAGITVTGGTPPFVYQWSSGSSTSGTAYNLPSGVHTVTVTDANHCVTSIPVQITQPVVLATQVSTTDVTCFNGTNGSIGLTATGGTQPYTYLWSNSSHASTLSGISAGNYSVVISDANGCTTSLNAIVNQPLPITIQPSTHSVNCFGGNDGYASVVVAGGNQPYSYQWSTGATSAMISGLSAASYSVTITDANGCTSSSGISIAQASAISLTTSIVDGTCGLSNGSGSVFASGGTSPYAYSWLSNGAVGASQMGLAAGLYSVRVTDANGCSSTVVLNIGNSGLMTASISSLSPVSCHAGNNASASVSLSGGAAPFTYNWSPGNYTTSSVSGLSAGNYICTIVDANSCVQTLNVSVSEPQEVVASASVASPVLCNGGSDGMVSVSVSGGVAPYSYSWNGSSSNAPSLISLGIGQYTVTVSDANGCTASSTASVSEPAPLGLITSAIPAQCGYADGSASVAVSGGVAPYSYNWAPANGLSSTLSNVLAGSYTVIVTDANSCTTSSSVGISNLNGPQAVVSVISNVNCNGGNDGQAQIQVLSGNAPYTFYWSSGIASGADVSGLSAGQHTATVTDVNGCVTGVNVTIIQPDRLLQTVSSLPVNCFGGNDGSATVSLTGGVTPYSCTWSNGDHLMTANNLSAGSYTAILTDANGCTLSSYVVVNQPAALTKSTTVVPVTCFGGSDGFATVQCSGGVSPYTFMWSDGSSSSTISSLNSGQYDVIITDANGCSASSHVIVNEPASVEVTSLSNPVSCFGSTNGSVLLNVIGGTEPYHYNWLPYGGNDAAAMNLPAGNYTAVVTDSHGCSATASNDVVNLVQCKHCLHQRL
ncbi:MAG: SprB repeat-containing protein [Bacteroidetes bacterium]|nr:SprB repeat-containing protein [Bacteroidota bacterium]